MTSRRIEAVLKPASVVLVGASATPGTLGELLCRNVREGGFAGTVYLVNPKHAAIGDQVCFPSVAALPEAPDLAVIVVPAAQVPGVIEECGARGIRGAVVISA